MDTDTLMYGAMRSTTLFSYNTAIVTPNSSLADLSTHPGFIQQPLNWCSTPSTMVPQTVGYFSISTPAALSDALLLLYNTMITDPLSMFSGIGSFPSTIILEQDLDASGVLQLAARQNSSVVINAPLLLSAPAYPVKLGVPLPASVTLDLAGCLGCMSLSDVKVQVKHIVDS